MRVRNDGFITFPLIGRLRVGGLTLNQIEKALVSRLGKDFLVNPQITVQVVEFSSKFINVLGAVKSPGGIPLKGPITLLETIAKAGRFDEEPGSGIAFQLAIEDAEGLKTQAPTLLEEIEAQL